ncbi:flagellar hook-length control protein FliK [Acidimangrovimonas sediminis]|uniref:flagellar hook-length control protein FliK n=1 Tax=Acidimangrovimonas sediminis TaxID=2056283 RepID=UPI0011AEF704|nr:flagellar hook-length control protein FliK [Acidimangrovimonas sediminis]
MTTPIGTIAAPGTGGAAARAASGGGEGFAALLGRPGARQTSPETASAASPTPPAAGEAEPDGAAQAPLAAQAGLSQVGASGAELLTTKVQLAQGLRTFEAETLQAMRSAEAEGGDAAAHKVLTGAAQALGALLGGADAALGTDTAALLTTLAQRMAGGDQGAAGAGGPGTKAGSGREGSDTDAPLVAAQQMFLLVAQALGLVAQPAQGAVGPSLASSPASSLAPSISWASGSDPGGAGRLAMLAGGTSSDPRLQALTEAVAGSAQAALSDGKVGAGLARQGAPHDGAAGRDGAAGLTAALPSDPIAQLLSAGAAQAQTPVATGGAATAAQVHVGSSPGAQAPAPAAAFAGMIGLQLRAAQPDEGVTRIALSPRGLGEIEIDMKRDAAGKLNVVVRAENPMVLTALRNDQARLGEILGGTGAGAAPTLDFESFGRGGGNAGRDERGCSTPASALEASDEGDDVPVWQDRIGRDALDIRT